MGMEPAVDPSPTRELPTEANGKQPALIETLRDKRKRLNTQREPLELDIPGYDGDLKARYKVLDWDELERIRRKAGDPDQNPRAIMNVQADTLVSACIEILINHEGTVKPLADIVPGADGPITYDHQLAEVFDLDADTARKTVLAVFGAFKNPMSFADHHNALMNWSKKAREEDDKGF